MTRRLATPGSGDWQSVSSARGLPALALAIALLASAGCYRAEQSLRQHPAGPPPSYAEVAQRYNANLRYLDRLWARVEVSLRWYEKGKKQFERGEGHLILQTPDNVALEVGKVGQTVLWAGSNPRKYWLFNLRAQPPEVFYGEHANVGKTGVQPLPMPVQPRDLVKLLGLAPLPASTEVEEATTSPGNGNGRVRWHGAYLEVEADRDRYRLLVDPRTYLPVRVEWLDVKGHVAASARLSLPQAVRVKGLASEQWPRWPSRLEAEFAGSDDRLTLVFTDDAYAGPQEDRVKPRLFDLDFLMDRYFKISATQRINLDAEGQQP